MTTRAKSRALVFTLGTCEMILAFTVYIMTFHDMSLKGWLITLASSFLMVEAYYNFRIFFKTRG